MKVEYYIIRGRGDDGLKFQLARLQDETGNLYKGLYDMSRQFISVDELKTYIADDIVKKPLEELEITSMSL
jgi:hypothetical protein